MVEEVVEPGEEQGFPGAGFGGTFGVGGTEAVAAGFEEEETVGDVVGGEGGVEEEAVFVADCRVVFAADEEDRRTVGTNVFLNGEGVLELFVPLTPDSESTAAGAGMGEGGGTHRDYGVDRCEELGAE